MTHAWLIIAHNEFGILQRLVTALDAPECDIYIHIDRKVSRLPKIHSEQSSLTFLPNRVDVRWGSVSQIRCEFALLEASAAQGPYDYYHIVSGTTLPLMPWSDISNYFKEKAGKLRIADCPLRLVLIDILCHSFYGQLEARFRGQAINCTAHPEILLQTT